MALEAEQLASQKLSRVLEKLNEFNAESLARPELDPALNFQQAVPVFARTLGVYKALSECNLEMVPIQPLNQLTDIATHSTTTFQQIMNFSLAGSSSNPIGTKNALVAQVTDQYPGLYAQASPIIAYAVRTRTDIGGLEKRAREMVGQIGTLVLETQNQLHKQVVDSETIVEKLRLAAQEAGVARHSQLFNLEAKEYQASAITWLRVTAGLGLTTLIAAVGLLCLYLWASSELTDKLQSLNLIAIKVLFFGVLISATLWAGRVYRSHQHNYVVNKHRANALSTFESFVKGATDDQTKSAVLLQTTQSIFASQPSGYITQEPDGGMYKQILEIVRGDPGARH